MRTYMMFACAAALGTAAAAHADPMDRALKVTSTAFADGTEIPTEYTCATEGGTDKAPPLAWSSVPKTTKSIAILVEDPDAPMGTLTHWMVSGLPANTIGLPAGGPLPHGAVALANEKGAHGYMGPCPPAGTGKHHYHFHVYALDLAPKTQPTSKRDFQALVEGHTVADGELIGTAQHHGK